MRFKQASSHFGSQCPAQRHLRHRSDCAQQKAPTLHREPSFPISISPTLSVQFTAFRAFSLSARHLERVPLRIEQAAARRVMRRAASWKRPIGLEAEAREEQRVLLDHAIQRKRVQAERPQDPRGELRRVDVPLDEHLVKPGVGDDGRDLRVVERATAVLGIFLELPE